MDDKIYFIIIIILTILILFYGGHNNQRKVEYDSKYFNSLYNISILENKIKKISNSYKWDDIGNYVNITNDLEICDNILPNFMGAYLIKLKPYSYFDVLDLTNDESNILIIFNYNKNNNLELVIKYDESIGYFYDLEKVISLTGVYPIYNNSNETINFILFIVKKPFWHK
jgi:hypothetical protein